MAQLFRDQSERDAFARRFSDEVDVVFFSGAGTATYTLETGYDYVVLSATADFFVRPDAATTVPTANVTDGTAPHLNPTQMNISGVTSLGFAVSAACTITVEYYTK